MTPTVLAAGGLAGRCYADLDALLQQFLLLNRLRGNEGDVARVRNGTRSWRLTPALLALGLQWIQERAQGIAFNNKALNLDDFKDMEGTFNMKDFRGAHNPIRYHTKSV